MECDICGREASIVHELGKPKPPYYDTLKICDECWNERERSKRNERNANRTGKREKKTYSDYE